MVVNSLIPDSESDGPRDRGQLILVGAVLIAFIIIGLVVVINTVLVTENVAKGESLDRARDTAQFDSQARRHTRSLVLRLNHDNRTVKAPQLTENVHRNISNYSRLLAEAYSNREPIWVNISYDNDSSEWGQRIVRASDGEFTSPSGDDDWKPVWTDSSGADTHREIGRFMVNLNVSETRSERFRLNITNASGDYINISMRAESAGGNSNILVNSPRQSGDSVCEPSNGRVLLDVLEGTAFTGDCEFKAPENIGFDGPYNLSVTNGSYGHGKLGIVVNESVSPATGSYPTCWSSPQDLCKTPVIWSANATVQYESAAIFYEQEHNVSVYP